MKRSLIRIVHVHLLSLENIIYHYGKKTNKSNSEKATASYINGLPPEHPLSTTKEPVLWFFFGFFCLKGQVKRTGI